MQISGVSQVGLLLRALRSYPSLAVVPQVFWLRKLCYWWLFQGSLPANGSIPQRTLCFHQGLGGCFPICRFSYKDGIATLNGWLLASATNGLPLESPSVMGKLIVKAEWDYWASPFSSSLWEIWVIEGSILSTPAQAIWTCNWVVGRGGTSSDLHCWILSPCLAQAAWCRVA